MTKKSIHTSVTSLYAGRTFGCQYQSSGQRRTIWLVQATRGRPATTLTPQMTAVRIPVMTPGRKYPSALFSNFAARMARITPPRPPRAYFKDCPLLKRNRDTSREISKEPQTAQSKPNSGLTTRKMIGGITESARLLRPAKTARNSSTSSRNLAFTTAYTCHSDGFPSKNASNPLRWSATQSECTSWR